MPRRARPAAGHPPSSTSREPPGELRASRRARARSRPRRPRRADLAEHGARRRPRRRRRSRARPRSGRRRARRRARAGRAPRAAAPIDARTSGRVASSSSAASSASSSCSSGARLQRDLVRQLGEPADAGDDERLAERERADRGAGGLAHRRRAQVDADVARGHQRPEPRLVDTALADDAVARRARAAAAAARGRSSARSRRRAAAAPPGGGARTRANASSSCGMRFDALTLPKPPKSGAPSTVGGRERPAPARPGAGSTAIGPA